VTDETRGNRPAPGARRRVLVVDDEPGMCYTARRILEPRYDVVEAPSGEAALERLAETHFHIALLDFRLPGLNGLELLASIKLISPSTDAVIMTGSAIDPDEALLGSIQRKAFFFLRKPFGAAVLESLVDRITETQLLDEQLQERTRNLEEGLSSAHAFQRSLLPPLDWSASKIEVAGYYAASAHLSGDLIDYWSVPGDASILLAADVMGHGQTAAMLTGIVKSQLRSRACDRRCDPGIVMGEVHEALRGLGVDRFLTLMLVLDDPAEERIIWAGAGHPAALLRTADGCIHRLESQTYPLNLPVDVIPRTAGRSLPRTNGARLLITTDGLADAFSPEGVTFEETPGFEALLVGALALPPARARDRIAAALQEHLRGLPLDDDCAFLVAELR
jgi:sigma-B regulation protein RsbU (phosphoserine phosphatase)